LPNHTILPDSPTNLLRRAFLYFIDVYVLYYVVSRTCVTRAAISEALAAFCLSSALLAPVAVFETLRGWLLYVDIAVRWTGDAGFGFYTLRGTTLRAMASTGGSLVLGYVLAIALGFWLYVGSRAASARTRIAVACLYVLGLLAAFSRGPWLGALAIYLAFVALGPRAVPRLFKAAAVMAIAMGALLASPLGERIESVLPFMGGSVDSSTIQYRQRLAARSWELFEQSPWFGDQLAYQKMQDLRQGMGIIDLVNTYASIALFYGGVGLFLFVAFILVALARAYRAARRAMRSDPDLSLLGVNLVACIIGTLVMIAACSLIDQYAIMFYVLGGLAVSYSRLQQVAEPSVVTGEVRA
jgi:O-antigen ligase